MPVRDDDKEDAHNIQGQKYRSNVIEQSKPKLFITLALTGLKVFTAKFESPCASELPDHIVKDGDEETDI